MAQRRRVYPHRTRHLRATAASAAFGVARRRARLQFRQLGAALGLHPRTVARWESGETHPSKQQWSKAVAYLARFVPHEAAALAKAAEVASPFPEKPPVDHRAIEQALLQAADQLDVSPRRVRAAVQALAQATANAGGSLADLARAASEAPAGPPLGPPAPG